MTVAEFTEALDALLESTRLLAAYDHPSMRPFSPEQARIFGALCETRDAKYRAILAALEREHENAERLRSARKIVDQQAEDEGLWFVAEFSTEAYLQTALRELHEAVETGAARKGVER